MLATIGWVVLVITVLMSLRNPRVAVFGMIWYDHIRPGDEFIYRFNTDGFFLADARTVKFSITYYAVAALMLLVQYRRYRITSDRFHWSIFFMFLAVVNSALFAPCFGPAIIRVDDYYKMFLQYYFICAFIRDEKQMRSLFWAIGLALLMVSFRYCYGKFILGEYRFEGATGDRNEMAMAMVMAFPFFLILGLTSQRRVTKIIAFASLAPLAASILFSLSRGAMLGLIAVNAYTLYRLHHKRWLIVLGVVVAIVGLMNMPPQIVARFSTIGTASKQDASAIGRLNAWSAARHILADRPMNGMGVGNFLVYFRRYADDPEDVHVAHSSFYQLMGDMGYPGLIVWIYNVAMLWFVTTWLEMRVTRLDRGKWTDTRYYLLIIKAAWVGYALCGAFLSQEDMDFFYHLLAICSRFSVFIEVREDIVRAEKRARIAAEMAALEEKRVRAQKEELGLTGGYAPNQGGYDPNQGSFDPNQAGYDPNQGYNPQGY